MSFHTPILLLWFNRPDLARQVIDRLRTLRPSRLFVAIDGPRSGHVADAGNVAESRALLPTIDWPCSLETRVLIENKGCRYAVSSAIDWFFNQVDEGIILEDDCLPDPTFFAFCEELLSRYRHDERVMHISGANLYGGRNWGHASYFFSRIPHVWGWATWRRAWQFYDVAMTSYPDFDKVGTVKNIVADEKSVRYWRHVLQATYAGKVDTWDYQWTYTVWRRNGLCVTPNQNLVTNTGFGQLATHTIKPSAFANLPTVPLTAIHHPEQLAENQDAMDYINKQLYRFPSWLRANVARVKQFLSIDL